MHPWPKSEWFATDDEKVLVQMENTRILVEQGHSLRKAAGIRLRQPLASFTYIAKENLSEEFEEILTDELNVKEVKSGKKLEFDLVITKELKNEGLARELERAVQEMRKKSGLKVGELAVLSYDTSDVELKAAFELFDTKKTYVSEIKVEPGGEEVLIEGKKVAIRLANEI